MMSRALFKYIDRSGKRFARVQTENGAQSDLSEADYLKRGFYPAFEGLLSREEYEFCRSGPSTRVVRRSAKQAELRSGAKQRRS
jgi:hypothetical protein